MRSLERHPEDTPYRFVDRPKARLRVVSLLVWGVSAFLLYMAVIDPPGQSWVVFGAFAIFGLCCYSVIHEFLLRPARVTTVRPLQRQVVVEETARWRKNELTVSLPPGTRFETFLCDSDNDIAYGVRIKSVDKRWITVAEYVSKDAAERLAREANARLCGW